MYKKLFWHSIVWAAIAIVILFFGISLDNKFAMCIGAGFLLGLVFQYISDGEKNFDMENQPRIQALCTGIFSFLAIISGCFSWHFATLSLVAAIFGVFAANVSSQFEKDEPKEEPFLPKEKTETIESK